MDTSFLHTIDLKTILSGAGIAYAASWLLFFALAPLLQKLVGNWKLASAIAYALSWVAMIVFFKLYASYASSSSAAARSGHTPGSTSKSS